MAKMQKVGTITSTPNNSRIWKAQIAAAYLGVEVEVNTKFEMGKTNKTPEFLAKYPYGKIPVMDTEQGPLYDSDAIAYYVANYFLDSPLLGKTNYERALVTKFVQMASNELSQYLAAWRYPYLGYRPYHKDIEEKAKLDTKRVMGALDQELKTKTFLVGERVTLADITMVSSAYSGYTSLFDASFRAEFPNFTRWFMTCINQPQFKKVIGAVKLCEVPEKYDEAKLKKASQKPAEKPEAPKKEEKKKNPLDLLSPSSFVLDAWKRQYSNEETPNALKWLWENYDPQGFSMWKCDYKYNDELGAVFMSSNLISGFFQRLERARKYAFGTLLVVGENNANQITGVFIFRGQDIPFEVSDAADFESYNFSKINTEDEASRKMINDFMMWEGSSIPGPCADGKIFK